MSPDIKSMMSSLGGVTPGAHAVRKSTKEEKDFETAQGEVDRMKKECAKYETPETYAKYGKM